MHVGSMRQVLVAATARFPGPLWSARGREEAPSEAPGHLLLS
jgi:hypothetical protein